MLHGFIVSFEKAERYNQETLLMEAKKKKREAAAAAREETMKAKGGGGVGGAGSPGGKEDAQFKMELNKAILQKVGAKRPEIGD